MAVTHSYSLSRHIGYRSALPIIGVGVVILLVGLLRDARPASATTPVGLGTAASFAVLAGSTVTNTGSSVINGDVGVSAGSSITGFPPGIVVPPSTQHIADAVAIGAANDTTTAYNTAAGETPVTSVATELAGATLQPGTYAPGGALALNGTVTLDNSADPDALFVFQSASTLITGSGSTVAFTDSAHPDCNVYWQVSSSATIGTNTAFAGTILASDSITANTGATVIGRLLAGTGAVTLDDNAITVPLCATTSSSPSLSSTPSTPASTVTGTATSGSGASGSAGNGTSAPAAGTGSSAGASIAINAGGGTDTMTSEGAGRTTANLASTGTDSRLLSILGVLTVLLGAVALFAGRRRTGATHRQ